jgi:transposase
MNNTKVQSYQVVEAILYKLKTGCQWRQLPMSFSDASKNGNRSIIIIKSGVKMEAGIKYGKFFYVNTNII